MQGIEWSLLSRPSGQPLLIVAKLATAATWVLLANGKSDAVLHAWEEQGHRHGHGACAAFFSLSQGAHYGGKFTLLPRTEVR